MVDGFWSSLFLSLSYFGPLSAIVRKTFDAKNIPDQINMPHVGRLKEKETELWQIDIFCFAFPLNTK